MSMYKNRCDRFFCGIVVFILVMGFFKGRGFLKEDFKMKRTVGSFHFEKRNVSLFKNNRRNGLSEKLSDVSCQLVGKLNCNRFLSSACAGNSFLN